MNRPDPPPFGGFKGGWARHPGRDPAAVWFFCSGGKA
jgi:hypothetical protein